MSIQVEVRMPADTATNLEPLMPDAAADAAADTTKSGSGSDYDSNKIVKIQSVWRGRKEKKAFQEKITRRHKEREERFAAADLFDAAFVIQRLVRRIRAQRAAKAEIARLLAEKEAANASAISSVVAPPAPNKLTTQPKSNATTATTHGSKTAAAGGAKVSVAGGIPPKVATPKGAPSATTSTAPAPKSGPKVVVVKKVVQRSSSTSTTAQQQSPAAAKVGASKSTAQTVATSPSPAKTKASAPAENNNGDNAAMVSPPRAAGSALAYLRSSPPNHNNHNQNDNDSNRTSTSAPSGANNGNGSYSCYTATSNNAAMAVSLGTAAAGMSAVGIGGGAGGGVYQYGVLPFISDRLLRFSQPPQDEELLRLFQALESTTRLKGTCNSMSTSLSNLQRTPPHASGGLLLPLHATNHSNAANNSSIPSGRSSPSPSSSSSPYGFSGEFVSEQACRELFHRFGGEVLLLKGESIETTVRAMLEKIVRPTAQNMPKSNEEIVVNFDQFCRFMLKLLSH